MIPNIEQIIERLIDVTATTDAQQLAVDDAIRALRAVQWRPISEAKWAAQVAKLTQERDDWKQSFIEANKAAEAAVDLADLRDGLAALEQECRALAENPEDDHAAFIADRLAALREGR